MYNFEMQPCHHVTWDIQHPSFIAYVLYSAMERDSTTIGIGNTCIAILEMYDTVL